MTEGANEDARPRRRRRRRRRNRHKQEAVDPRLLELRAMDPKDLPAALPLIDALADEHPAKSAFHNALNAYRSVIEYDATGAVTPRASGNGGATAELRELIEQLGRFDVARQLFASYVRRWPRKQGLRDIEALLPEALESGAVFRDDKDADVQVATSEGSDVTFLVFGGKGNGFGISFTRLQRLLANMRVNAVFFRDFNRALYLNGIQSLGDDADATVAKLRDMVASMGTRRLICIGNSVGGFAALYYGALLPAQHVISFSAPTSLEFAMTRPSKAAYYAEMVALSDAGVVKWPNIRAMYEGRTDISAEIFFAGGHAYNREQAELMAGLSNVALRAVDDFSSHAVVPELLDRGIFLGILEQAARPDGSVR